MTTDNSVLSALKKQYPNQYYCSMGKPCAWYNMWVYSSAEGLPDVSTLFALTAAQWAAKGGDTGTKSMAVIDGVLQDYTPPAAAISLETQATTVLASARTYIYNNYGILNEATPDAWVTYLKALMAIANGTDTTSTALPTAPAS